MPYLLIFSLILLVAGLAGLLFMVARKVPTLVKLPPPAVTVPAVSISQRLKHGLKGIKYSTYRPLILSGLEKLLRKVRLLILKVDNLFTHWIKSARHRSEIWTVRSKAWIEHSRQKSKEKAQVLEKLDKVEISETLEKIKQEVAADEDEALKEKIENISDSETVIVIPASDEEEESSVQEEMETDEAVTVEPEEKKYIDLIAQNPKNAEAYRMLGFIYLGQKNYSDARACFRRVLKFTPDDEAIKNKLNEIKGLRNKNRNNPSA